MRKDGDHLNDLGQDAVNNDIRESRKVCAATGGAHARIALGILTDAPELQMKVGQKRPAKTGGLILVPADGAGGVIGCRGKEFNRKGHNDRWSRSWTASHGSPVSSPRSAAVARRSISRPCLSVSGALNASNSCWAVS